MSDFFRSLLWCSIGKVSRAQALKLIQMVAVFKPAQALETGFATGRSAASVLRAGADSIKQLISIDKDLSWTGLQGPAMACALRSAYPCFELITGASQAVLSEQFFATRYPDGLDFGFVDGEHSYAACLHDLSQMAAHLNAEGVVVVDDYCSGPPKAQAIPEVNKAVNDFLATNGDFAMERWSAEGKSMAIIRRRRPVTILQNFTGPMLALKQISAPMHECYAKRRGYDLRVTSIDAPSGLIQPWSKIVCMLDWLSNSQNADVAVWLDADTLVIRDEPLEFVLEKDKDLGLVLAEARTGEYYNTGVMFVRHNQKCLKFFQDVLAAGPFKTQAEGYPGSPYLGEQGRINALLRGSDLRVQELDPKYNSYTMTPTPRPTIVGWHGLPLDQTIKHMTNTAALASAYLIR